ncbi:kinase-like domain-containing protein [Rhizophagus diaphanus]|nr:kinase-like domain-containing protein [Rhizophagus diaphanus] [Rhizophagus sp. MUCL 43196]
MQTTNNSNEWVEEAVSKKHIKYYEYKDFRNIKKIGNDNFGKVYSANWENSEQYFALKSLSNFGNNNIKDILEIHREVQFDNNIISFYGIIYKENPKGQFKKYLLHSGNILIHQDNIKLSDFGLSKKVEISSGHPPFEDESYDISLVLQILQGYRESIPDTPPDYSNIYTKCWDGEPDNRPDMIQIVNKLRALITNTSITTENQVSCIIES